MYRVALVVVLLVLLLGVRFWSYYRDFPEYKDGQEVGQVFVVNGQPEELYGRQSFKVKDKYGAYINVVVGASPKVNLGDRVFIDGVFTKKLYKGHSFVSV